MPDITLEQKLNLLHHDRSDSWLWLIRQLTNPIVDNSFDAIEIEGLDTILADQDSDKQYVFISDHESEMDWIILQRIFSKNKIPTVVQAGDNLFVPGIGYILKKAGGYMAIRDEHTFHVRGQKYTLNKKEYAFNLYARQLERILDDERNHALIFPGYAVDRYSGLPKAGRSYDGKYNGFSPVVFARVVEAAKKRDLTVVFKEVKISYERIPEDTAFREFQNISKRSKLAKNVYDHLNTFVVTPWQKRIRGIKPRVLVRFGKEHIASGKGKHLAEEVYDGIGKLLRVYPSQLVFASTDDRYKISKDDLWDNMRKNMDKLDAYNVDLSAVMDGNTLMDLDRMLCRIEKLFNYQKIPIVATRNYTTLEHDMNEVFIWHPHLARYYGNKLNYILKPKA